MNSAELLNRLSEQQIQIWAEGGQLRYRAPKQALTPELRTLLARHKNELLEILNRRQEVMQAAAPLSYNQLGLWFLHKVAPESVAYHVAFSARLLGELDGAAFRRAWQALVERHAALRTTLAVSKSGVPLQQVHLRMDLGLLEEDVAAWSEEALNRQLRDAYQRPFDLERGPLVRVYLYRRSPGEHVLLIVLHHIIADGWASLLLVDELSTLYTAYRDGTTPQLPPESAPYTDYARWQRQMLAGPEGTRLWTYWRQQLAGELPMLDLPTDRPRPAVASIRGATHPFTLDATLKARLETLARRERTTLHVLLLSAFATLLHRYTGQDELLVGSPAYGRNRAEFAGTIGDMMNMVVLRLKFEGDPPFTALLHQARRTVLEALDYQDYPFALLVERLQPERVISRPPLVQAACLYQKFEQFKSFGLFSKANAAGQGQVELEIYPMAQQEGQFELALELIEKDGLIGGNLKYATDLFEVESIERLACSFQVLLRGVVENPSRRVSELPLLEEPERRALLEEAWNEALPLEIPPQCLHELIADQARRTPGAVAVVGEREQLTYAELNRRANRLARHLAALGVGSETLVGLCLTRSPAMVVALLGILKAGGAYVPLDPAFPCERLAMMLEDAQAPVLLTESRMAASLPVGGACVMLLDALEPALDESGGKDPPCAATPENCAYVLYTSGSTGRPKGVQITHRALVNCLLSFQREPGFSPSDALLAVTTLSFDIAGLELWLPLLSGGRTIIVGQEAATDPHVLMHQMQRLGATVMQATPATWRMLLDAGWRRTSLAKIFCGGEALPRELADRLLATGAEVWNLYGPTETTIWSAIERVKPGTLAPAIGRPIANTRLCVLDRRLNPVPVGVPGELHIGGAGLARGYLGRPDLTAGRFIRLPGMPEAEGRLYKTGDLVRRRADGTLEFLGRMDHQIKLRGFRIEPGEIEAALLAHPAVGAAIAIAAQFPGSDKRLLAWWVPRSGAAAPPTEENLRAHLRDRLPAHMIPAALIRLEAFPLTPNGKVDRRALPLSDSEILSGGAPPVAPRTPLEETLAAIWADVLHLNHVGIHDNFFALGGHSLLATQVISRIRGTLNCEAPLRLIFEAPTVAELAKHLEPGRPARHPAAVPPILPGRREGPQPLSFSQQRMWFMQQLSPDSIAYNMSGMLQLEGPLHLEALRRTLGAIAERHEALRTTFDTINEEPAQLIGDKPHLTFEAVDLTYYPPAERDAAAMAQAAAEARKPFDLARGPLSRFFLYRLAPDCHLLLISMHHIIFDLWSFGIFGQELSAFYAHFAHGEPLQLPPLPVQYSDFARWQRDWFHGEALQAQLDYWKRQLAGHRVLELPLDRTRPALQSFLGAQRYLPLDPALILNLKDFSAREGATPFIVLLAVFGILLWRYSGQDDIIIGSPIANRNRLEIEGLLGTFVNTLAMRIDLSNTPSFSELLRRVREMSLDAYANQDIPFDKLVEELHPERDMSHSPIVQVLFNQFNVPAASDTIAGLSWRPRHLDRGAAQFDLSLTVDLDVSREAILEYNTSLFEAATADRMLAHFKQAMEEVLAHPDRPIARLDLLGEAERHQTLEQWNETGTVYPEATIPEPKWQSLVPMQPKGNRTPFFLVAGAHANEAEFLRYLSNLIPYVGSDQPIYGFKARGLDGRQPPHADVETMARDYLAEMRAFQPRGPYLLGGECVGGIVAYEMAQQLLAQGEQVGLLVLMDTHRPTGGCALFARLDDTVFRLDRQMHQMLDVFRKGLRAGLHEFRALLKTKRPTLIPRGPEERRRRQIKRIEQNYSRILLRYRPKPYPGKLTLLVNHKQHRWISKGWQELARAGLEVQIVPGDHNTRLVKYGRISAERLRGCLDRAHEALHLAEAVSGGVKP